MKIKNLFLSISIWSLTSFWVICKSLIALSLSARACSIEGTGDLSLADCFDNC